MSRFGSLLSLLLFPPASLCAQDSVATFVVVPGVSHARHVKSGPFVVNVLRVGLASSGIQLESYRPAGLVKTTQQAKENTRPGHSVIAAVNADFFSFKTQWPLSNQVVNGRFVLGTRSKRSHIAVDGKNRVYFKRLSFTGFALARGERWKIDGVNTNRGAEETVAYNSFWGSSTRTDTLGSKVTLRLGGTQWVANDTMILVVVSQSGKGEAPIPEEGLVLSGPVDFSVRVADTVRVFLGFADFGQPVVQVIGGAGRILESGRNTAESNVELEGLAKKFLTDRHPRTFVGLSRDAATLFLCTVDGRQPSSVGMQFDEMAAFLTSLGVWDAINLDGGGSTTMVVQGSIVNSPSDKIGERAVANSLQVISPN